MVSPGDIKQSEEEVEKKTIDGLMATMKTQLSFTRKTFMRNFLLPLARRAVGMREQTKSIVVYSTDLTRQALRKLAKRMHEEGRIPEEDLLYHLTLYEIEQLFTYRNPLFIAKAKQRKRAIEKMDKWVFDEVVKGYEFKPRNVS
jgi:prophage antirepressor-like protein